MLSKGWAQLHVFVAREGYNFSNEMRTICVHQSADVRRFAAVLKLIANIGSPTVFPRRLHIACRRKTIVMPNRLSVVSPIRGWI